MTSIKETKKVEHARFATQAIFLVCGLGISTWAPMVPYAMDRLELDEASMGFLLLFLGAGAIVSMPITGWLISRFGTRRVILVAAMIMTLTLPGLLRMETSVHMGIVLFIFGSGVGSIDVAMNAQGVQVQNLAGKPIMSSLHGFFSVGGLLGPLAIGALIASGLTPFLAAASISLILILIVLGQFGSLLDSKTENEAMAHFSMTQQTGTKRSKAWVSPAVLFLGAMSFIVFLTEGAILDWSALFLRDYRAIPEAYTGLGYAGFSLAMAFMRLVGDRIVDKFSSVNIVVWGSVLAVCGFFILVLVPSSIASIVGFVLIGLGSANIVPVFFSEAGRIPLVPSAVAIPAITTMGYAGQLAGPALLGFVAQWTSLAVALGLIGFLMLLVAISYGVRANRP